MGITMTKRDFNAWLRTFQSSINGYDYYTDFKKVYDNVDELKVELNMLNSLVGSKEIEADFIKLISKYPECLRAIPIMLAVRAREVYCQDINGSLIYQFDKMANSKDDYCYFMRKTGLFGLIQNHIISNLYDYVTGVEVGLDSNGRKNRGGHQMEGLVEYYIRRTGVEYYKEMYLNEIESKWNADLSAISAGGTSTKRWDFVVYSKDCIYLVETNFYASSGSKLNETARSYKMIAQEVSGIESVYFVWVTDGHGWNNAKGNLKETFDNLETIYNINDLKNGAFDTLFKHSR